MQPIAWGIIALTVLPASYLAWSIIVADRKSRLIIQGNLSKGLENSGAAATPQNMDFERLARKLTPTGYEAKLDRLLALAGRPASMPLPRLLVAKPALALVVALLMMLMLSRNSSPQMILLAVFSTGLAYFVPDLLIHSRGAERQKKIQLELPNTLDQMLIAVEAGLGFESAMARAGQNGKGPLAEELVRTLQDMQVGRSRRDSYLALADRSNVQDLRSFVRAVVQADAYGIAIAKVLKAQAREMRVKRRQRAEQKAMKLPVLVLFPLLLFIFPVIFIVILGPAVINIIEAFS
ncbi:type II secretion system F family protein [Arthrobacter sp. ISL-72]|uniref:type II secretion system F family protein n=1 Tax=Arthrobacter sp. ISL-72 TaxID=2819114 RepID=UPI001BE6B081|nr:type II secretion system F family protein [Arthrobacter sp. ISL-72]MBT2594426.1 type II secretion system F family protein [Arthrobacter sp. ISL-72]